MELQLWLDSHPISRIGPPTSFITRLVDIPSAQRPWRVGPHPILVTERNALFQFLPVLSTEKSPVPSREGRTLIADVIRV